MMAICIGKIKLNTVDGATKLVQQGAILGGLSIDQLNRGCYFSLMNSSTTVNHDHLI